MAYLLTLLLYIIPFSPTIKQYLFIEFACYIIKRYPQTLYTQPPGLTIILHSILHEQLQISPTYLTLTPYSPPRGIRSPPLEPVPGPTA